MWVLPGMQLLSDPAWSLTVAGLYVTVQASASAGTVSLQANVTMIVWVSDYSPAVSDVARQDGTPTGPPMRSLSIAELRGAQGQQVPALRLVCTSTSLFTVRGESPLGRL